MSKEQYLLRDDPDFCLAHVMEEAGELVAAIGKCHRWGWRSVNPELLEADQETNIDWALREMSDVEDAIFRFRNSLR